jgi:hypothetical protein
MVWASVRECGEGESILNRAIYFEEDPSIDMPPYIPYPAPYKGKKILYIYTHAVVLSIPVKNI